MEKKAVDMIGEPKKAVDAPSSSDAASKSTPSPGSLPLDKTFHSLLHCLDGREHTEYVTKSIQPFHFTANFKAACHALCRELPSKRFLHSFADYTPGYLKPARRPIFDPVLHFILQKRHQNECLILGKRA